MKVASRLLCPAGAVLLAFGLATAAHAEHGPHGGGGDDDDGGGVAVASVGRMALGSVVSAAAGVTVFHVNEQTGAVTVTSGSGARGSSAGDARAMVMLTCGSNASCERDPVRIRVGSINLETGRGQQLSNFMVQMGSAVLASPPIPGDPVDFTIRPIGRNGSRTFYIGADVPILGDDASASPLSTAQFYVHVGFAPAIPTTGSSAGLAIAAVTRALKLSAAGALSFGSLYRPQSGVGTAVVDPDQGAYHNTNIIAASQPGPSRVVFTATGEPDKAISVSIPHDFYLTAPSGAKLDVTISSNAGSAETLNSAGVYTFGVGGSINVSSTTPSGVYKGSFTVTVAYN